MPISGNYTAYIRKGKNYILCNDNIISDSVLDDFVKKNSYLLVYDKSQFTEENSSQNSNPVNIGLTNSNVSSGDNIGALDGQPSANSSKCNNFQVSVDNSNNCNSLVKHLTLCLQSLTGTKMSQVLEVLPVLAI